MISESLPVQLPLFLENLEARIAPATITIGGNYSDNDTLTSTAAQTADKAIQEFFDASANHYYLKLNKGDKLLFDADGPDGDAEALNWIEIKAGTAYVFLTDDGDGVIELDELSGLSLGGKASLRVFSDVNGSIVTNVDGATGTFLGTTLADGAKNSIAELSVAGSVSGSLLSLGSINKVIVEGDINEIRTGSATSGVKFDFGGDTGRGQGNAGQFEPAAKVAGPSISTVYASDIGALIAGDGGAQAAGGSISKITLAAEDGCLVIQAGEGGKGSATAINGGNGGKVSEITIYAATQAAGGVVINSGDGGDGHYVTDTKIGKGGNAGAVEKITIGAEYDKPTKSWNPSGPLITNEVAIQAGAGGSGKTGGIGGKVSNVAVFNQDAPLEICGGDGGDALYFTSTKDGTGGAIETVTAISLATNEDSESGVFLQAGSAGELAAFGSGAAGGSLSSVVAGGLKVTVFAGDGSSGISGGTGGSITGLSINTAYVGLQDLTLIAGDGGEGQTRAGGAGGSIKSIVVDSSAYIQSLPGAAPTDAQWITVIPTTSGEDIVVTDPALTVDIEEDLESGAVFRNVTIATTVYEDVEVSADLDGTLLISQTVYGKVILEKGIFIGGDLVVSGPSGGVFIGAYEYNVEKQTYEYVLTPLTEDLYPEYVAGEVVINQAQPPLPKAWQVDGYDLTVQAGNGGNSSGAGGQGGSISSATFWSSPYPFESLVEDGHDLDWDIRAGHGGNGNGKAGAGGDLTKVSVSVETLKNAGFSHATFVAGDGGNAVSSGTGGAGGNIRGGTFSLYAGDPDSSFSAFLAAGDGGMGADKGKGGAGGSLLKDGHPVVLETTVNAAIASGDGGDASAAVAGGGGSILSLAIHAAIKPPGIDGIVGHVDLTAGHAGNSSASKGTSGGSIKNLVLGNSFDVEFSLTAGNGNGNGGAGGNIENLTQASAKMLYNYDGTNWVVSLNSNNFTLTAMAGMGSGSGTGGSIKSVNLAAPDVRNAYNFIARSGGSGEKPGNGGSIEKLSIVDSMVVDTYNPITGKPQKTSISFDYSATGFGGVGQASLSSGNGGDSTGSANGGNGGNIKNVFWDVDGLTRDLLLGAGGTSVSGSPGTPGKTVNVQPSTMIIA